MGENNLVWQQFCTNISYYVLKPRFQTRNLKNTMVSNELVYKC